MNQAQSSIFRRLRDGCGSLYHPIHPNLSIVRGGVPFHAGLEYIHHFFLGKTFVDLYHHPYFIETSEKHYQPSPQLHLTEEIQNVNMVMKGMRYFTDRLSLLDQTMIVASDMVSTPTGPQEQTVLYNPCQLDPSTKADVDTRLAKRNVTMIVFPTTSAWRSFETYALQFPNARLLTAGPIPENEVSLVPGSESRIELLGTTTDTVQLTPKIRLLRVKGDDHTNEYLLHHEEVKALGCCELYHGGYADFDPSNSWVCRVWFKFQKEGNYKRDDIVPRFKLLQIEKAGSMELVKETIERISTLELGLLISAHGTQPISGHPILQIRKQWGMGEIPVKEVDYSKLYVSLSRSQLDHIRPKQKGVEDMVQQMPRPMATLESSFSMRGVRS